MPPSMMRGVIAHLAPAGRRVEGGVDAQLAAIVDGVVEDMLRRARAVAVTDRPLKKNISCAHLMRALSENGISRRFTQGLRFASSKPLRKHGAGKRNELGLLAPPVSKRERDEKRRMLHAATSIAQ